MKIREIQVNQLDNDGYNSAMQPSGIDAKGRH